jgi:hypothetical protein
MVALDDPVTLRDASPDPRVRAFFNRQSSMTQDQQQGGEAMAETAPAR